MKPISLPESIRRRHSLEKLLVSEEEFNDFHTSFLPQIEERYGFQLIPRMSLSRMYESEYDFQWDGQSLLSLYARLNAQISDDTLLPGCPIPRQLLFAFPEEKEIDVSTVTHLYRGMYGLFGKECPKIPYRLYLEIADEVHRNANHILLASELFQQEAHAGEFIGYYVQQDNARIIRYGNHSSETEFRARLAQEFPDIHNAFAVLKLEPELLEAARIDHFNVGRIVDEFERGL